MFNSPTLKIYLYSHFKSGMSFYFSLLRTVLKHDGMRKASSLSPRASGSILYNKVP